jgi:hypothetical protein
LKEEEKREKEGVKQHLHAIDLKAGFPIIDILNAFTSIVADC